MASPTFHEGARRSRPRTSCVRCEKRRSTKRREADYVLPGRGQPTSLLHIRQRDSRSTGWNHKLQATRTHTSCHIFAVFREESLRWVCVYEERLRKRLLFDGLHELVRLSIKTCGGAHKDATLQSTSPYPAPLIKLQEGSKGATTPSRSPHYDQRKPRTSTNRKIH